MTRLAELSSLFLAVVIAALILAYASVSAHAQEIDRREVQAVADRVGMVLLLRGYEVDTHDLPAARLVDLRNGHAGETDGREIRISARTPETCREMALGHEIAHVILGRSYGLTPEQSEPIARAVEAAIAGDDYLPNCGVK